ncbi:MAG: triple tyrosine motif-containing protein, partial [Acidobacteriaceae bacterium]
TGERGVFRVRGDRVEHFDRADGLSSNSVNSFYQDQEGTIWVVTSAGIDNFRDLHVASYSMHEGLAADGAVSVVASHDGGLWVLENNEIVQKLQDGTFSMFLPRPGVPGHHVSTLLEDHAGRLWFGLEHGLYVEDHGAFRPILHSDGSPLGIIFSIAEDAHHDIWVRAGPNLDRIEDFEVRSELTSPQISTSYILAATPDGGIVLGLVDGNLVRYRNGETQTVASDEVGNTRQIHDLIVDPDGTVWGTTLDELFALRGMTRKNLTVRNGLPCDGIFALVEDDSQAIWLYSQCGLIRIARAELNNWWQHPDSVVHTQVLDESDGVQPELTSLKPQTAKTLDGRLWFANGRLLQSVDVAHPGGNSIPPPVQIESVIADRESYTPREGLRLGPRTRDLEIAYTAFSYVAPQKVRFRYRLEGRDPGWQDPGTRRQAFYTDLGPGNYRFRVIASNNDGVWNDAGAQLNFSIAPAWYQTMWFEFACSAFILLVVWAIFQLRMRRLAAAMNARFDERLDERTRLAREFHDTLLQTIQGSKMVADDALDEPVDSSRMHRALEKLSTWMGQATQEGRAALNSLRASTTQRNDLADAFRRATEDDLIPSSMSVAISVVGIPGEMHPIVRDEICRIGYEAIRNASLHSRASQLDVELSYTQDLMLRVKDKGVGIDPGFLDKGKDGHYGLQGMRERSARIGGKLSLFSSAASGTEIRLVVPGNIIFRAAAPVRDLAYQDRNLFQKNRGYS